MSASINVLIVDDSALMRQMLVSILERDPAIKVVGAAADALKAREMIKKLNPDVLTLDIEMPKMNGLDFLKKIMALRPMPVVMISTLTQDGADVTLQALEIGAVDFVGKPQLDFQRNFEEKAQEIINKVKIAAVSKVHALETSVQKICEIPDNIGVISKKMIVIGSSTGGVEALRVILSSLPVDMPPIFVVQHMPPKFTTTFAARLSSLSRLNVKEAEDGEIAERGYVYIAPGDQHLGLEEINGQVVCKLSGGENVGGHMPSATVLFNSAASFGTDDTIGVILSGMGKDGSQGLALMKEKGAFVIGQNEKTCVVYGMPKVAMDLGVVDVEYDLKNIAEALINLCRKI